MMREGRLSRTAITQCAVITGGAAGCTTEKQTDLSCRIEYDETGEVHRVFYEECDDGGSFTENELILPAASIGADPCLRVLRRGPVSAEFRFVAGEEDTVILETPYGAMAITIATDRVRSEKTEAGILCEVRYRIRETMEDHQIRYEIICGTA